MGLHPQIYSKSIFNLFLIQPINISLSEKGEMDSSIQSIGASLRPSSASKGPGGPPSHENVISQFGQSLTEEQRTSILKTISELQESGASFEEIKGVVDSFLEENGITPPSQRGPGGPGGGPLHNESVISQLTEEQLSSILAKVAELQESGASFDEVKYTVDTFLEENGIELPSKGGTFIDTIT